MNYKRKKEHNRIFFLDDLKQDDSPIWPSEQQDLSQSDILYQCIDELNDFNKAIILLYLDGNSHEEISEITGISNSNVGTRISRIKEQLIDLATTKL